MEKAFLQDRLTKNPYQDPMGRDAHQGLERWLDKFHQPTVPNYTIITDPEYYVFIWFHDAIGNLIRCPYVQSGWEPKLKGSSVDYAATNRSLWGKGGIQSGTDDTSLPLECIDLTPFVREATLPEIKPANGEPIDTLFGKTTAGSFSPYASDGQQTISLQMVDTEFSILDSLFYPWMKDINSPWWYRPDKVYTEWATPYPMATLEVQRPRMRYRSEPEPQQSRADAKYSYYSYKYIGVKPVSYNAFQVNGNGVSSLLRSLTLSCDMCLVDLTGDVAGSADGSTNLGNRSSLIFDSTSPDTGSGSQPDDDGTQEGKEPDYAAEQQMLEEQEAAIQSQIDDTMAELEQQALGDMPGEDEAEWVDQGQPGYSESEYEDGFGDGESSPAQMDMDEESLAQNMQDDSDFDNTKWSDEPESWEGDGASQPGEPNGDLADYTMETEAQMGGGGEGEPSLVQNVQEGMMDNGSDQAQATSSEQGWTADGSDGAGIEPSILEKAVGGAVDLVQSGVDLVVGPNDVLDTATSMASKAIGAAGSILSSAMKAVSTPLLGGQSGGGSQTQSGGLLSTLGGALSKTLGKASTAFGAVANAISAQNGNSTTVGGVFDKALSCAFPSSGDTVGNAANVIGGVMSMMGGGGLSASKLAGAVMQMSNAKGQVGSTQVMASTLNSASSSIASSLGPVGGIASSILNVGSGDGLGQLVSRMVSSKSAKPTPLESFVGMVVKQDVKGSSMV